MFRHVVMFRWKPETPADTKDAVAAGLAELPIAIPEIAAYRFGPDAGLRDDNWDYVVVADFDDVAGYEIYRDHDVHQALVGEKIAPHVEARAAVQYTIDA